MITAPAPTIEDPKIQEEIRKALISLVLQLNRELEDIRRRLTALEP